MTQYRQTTAPTPRVTASSVNTIVAPSSEGAPSQTLAPIDPMIRAFGELSQSYSSLSSSLVSLGRSVKGFEGKQDKAGYDAMKALLNQNNENLAKLVENGLANPSENPHIQRGRGRAVGEALARQFEIKTESVIGKMRATNPAFADTAGAMAWFEEESASYFRSMPDSGGDRVAMEKAFGNGIAGYRARFEVSQNKYAGDKALEDSRVGFAVGVQDMVKNAAKDRAAELRDGLEGPSFATQNMVNQITGAIDDDATGFGPDMWPLTYTEKNRLAVDALIQLAKDDPTYTALAVEALERVKTGPKGSRADLKGDYAKSELLKAQKTIDANIGLRRRGGNFKQAARRWQDGASQMAVGRLMSKFDSGVINMRNVEDIETVIKESFDEAVAVQNIFDEGELVRVAQSDSEKVVYQINTDDGESFTIEMDMREITASARNEITMLAYQTASEAGAGHADALTVAAMKTGIVPSQFKREVESAFDALSNFTLGAGQEIDPEFVASQAQQFHERVYEPWAQLQRAGFEGRMTGDRGQEQLMDIYQELIQTQTPAEAVTKVLQIKGRDLDISAFSQKVRQLTVGTQSSPSILDESQQAHIDDIEDRATMMKLIEPSMTPEECIEYGIKAFDRDTISLAGRRVPKSAFNKRDAEAVQEIQQLVGKDAADGPFVGGMLSGMLSVVDTDVQAQLVRAEAGNLSVDYVAGRGYQVKIAIEGELPFAISNPFRDDNVFTSADIKRIAKAYSYFDQGHTKEVRDQLVEIELGVREPGEFTITQPKPDPSLKQSKMPEMREKKTDSYRTLSGEPMSVVGPSSAEEKAEYAEELLRILNEGNRYGGQ